MSAMTAVTVALTRLLRLIGSSVSAWWRKYRREPISLRAARRLLEVVVLDDDPDEEPVITHAMELRPKFHHYLR